MHATILFAHPDLLKLAAFVEQRADTGDDRLKDLNNTLTALLSQRSAYYGALTDATDARAKIVAGHEADVRARDELRAKLAALDAKIAQAHPQEQTDADAVVDAVYARVNGSIDSAAVDRIAAALEKYQDYTTTLQQTVSK